MTLAELTQEVYTLTNRPDRVAETSSAIKAATLKAHQSDYYYKDLFETAVMFTTAEYIQQFDYRTLIPRWRAIKYLQQLTFDSTTGQYDIPGKLLDLVEPVNVFDDYHQRKVNSYYVAGAFVQIRNSCPVQYFGLGCYLNPDIGVSTYNSWVAIDHPYAIVFDAAATVFKAIGKDEEAAIYRNLVIEQIGLVKSSNIISQGY